MKKLISKLIPHFHNFKTPIVSRYVSFNTRDIIYECSCGKRKSFEITTDFGESFPIPTSSFMSHADFEKILKGAQFEKIGQVELIKLK